MLCEENHSKGSGQILGMTFPGMIVVVKRAHNPPRMHRRRRHNQQVEYLMRTPPYIKPPRLQRFRYAGAVEESPEDQEKAFQEVEGHSALFVHLLYTEKTDTVDKWRQAG